MTTTKPVHAAYIHIPFCAHHCGYCDFAIATGQDHLIELYLDALAIELSRLGEPQPMRTLFLGGGTPTYLSRQQLARMLDDVRRWLPPETGHEFSIEANPDTLDADKVSVLADHGVNRVSLGVQSFAPHLLGVQPVLLLHLRNDFIRPAGEPEVIHVTAA